MSDSELKSLDREIKSLAKMLGPKFEKDLKKIEENAKEEEKELKFHLSFRLVLSFTVFFLLIAASLLGFAHQYYGSKCVMNFNYSHSDCPSEAYNLSVAATAFFVLSGCCCCATCVVLAAWCILT